MLKRALIYARVSTDEQVEKYGLPAQFRACREYAVANGFEVVEEIADDGYTGAILSRPGLDRLRKLIAEGAASIVLMLDPDRLSRDLEYLLRLKREIEAHARLEFVTARFEDTTNGKLFFAMKGMIAEWERGVIRDRTMRGKAERAKSGRRVGGRTPFGYIDQAGELVVDPDRASVAQQIFSWHDAGVSMLEITSRLRSAGVKTWSGKPWWYTSVRSILTNEVYAGVQRWGAEGIVIPAPALVSREQWERVQARLKENPAPTVGRPSSAYLLRGLIHCFCGLRMYGETCKIGGNGTRRYHFYRCRERNRTMPRERYCGGAVNATRLDSAVWDAISGTFTDSARLRAAIAERESAIRSLDPSRVEQLEGHVQKLRRREQAALDLMADPDLAADRPAIKRQYLDAQTERRRVEAEILAARRVTSIREGSWIDETAGLIRRYLANLDAPEKRQEFVRRVVSRADWSGEELKIACFIGPKSSSLSQETVSFPERVEILLTARIAA